MALLNSSIAHSGLKIYISLYPTIGMVHPFGSLPFNGSIPRSETVRCNQRIFLNNPFSIIAVFILRIRYILFGIVPSLLFGALTPFVAAGMRDTLVSAIQWEQYARCVVSRVSREPWFINLLIARGGLLSFSVYMKIRLYGFLYSFVFFFLIIIAYHCRSVHRWMSKWLPTFRF